MTRFGAFAAALLAFAVTTPLYAQSQAYGPPRPSDCNARLATATQVSPSIDARGLQSKLASVATCHPELERAIASAIRATATSSDTAVLRTLYLGLQHRDTATVFAALDVASAGSAAPTARVYAFGSLIHALDPYAAPRYVQLVNVAAEEFCEVPLRGGAASDSGVVTSAIASQIRDAAAATYGQSGAGILKSAAFCVLDAWRQANGLPRVGYLVDPTGALTASAVCVDVYAIRNSNQSTLEVVYDAPGVAGAKTMLVPGRSATEAYREIRVRIPGSTQMRMSFDGVPFAEIPRSSVACTGAQ